MEAKEQTKNQFTRKRQEFTIGIRKHRIQQILTKRRNQADQDREPNDEQGPKICYIVDERYADYTNKFQRSRYFPEALSQLHKAINDPDIIQQHYGVIGIRKIMSLSEDPPIQLLIDMGIVPRLIELVKQEQYPQLQLQATWSLANVASGNQQQCNTIINKDAIPMFIKLLKSNHSGIVQQAIWAIGNIASDSTFNRDAVIRNGGIPNLIYATSNVKSMDLIQPGAWALSNLCRGTPPPNYQLIKQGVLFLGELLTKYDLKQNSIFSDCCWSICYNFPKKQEEYKRLISKQLILKLKQKLKTQQFGIIIPIVRILSHITKINDYYVDLVLQNEDIIQIFYELLSYQRKIVRSETCWIISNIFSSPQRNINKFLQNQRLIAKLLQLFQTDAEETKRQLCFLFANMTSQGNPQIIFKFYKEVNIVKYYILGLSSQDSKLIKNSLQTMYQVLLLGQKFKQNNQNPFVVDIADLGALPILQELQLHDQIQIYQAVVKIMKQFFQMEDSII